LTTSLLRLATAERLETFLPATVNFLRDAQFLQVLFFGFWPHPAARFRSLYRFFNAPEDLTEAFSLGTS
jgi:hypothetical protein